MDCGGKKCPVISSRADTSSAGLATTTTTKPKVMKVKSNRPRFQRDSVAYIFFSSHRPPTTWIMASRPFFCCCCYHNNMVVDVSLAHLAENPEHRTVLAPANHHLFLHDHFFSVVFREQQRTEGDNERRVFFPSACTAIELLLAMQETSDWFIIDSKCLADISNVGSPINDCH